MFWRIHPRFFGSYLALVTTASALCLAETDEPAHAEETRKPEVITVSAHPLDPSVSAQSLSVLEDEELAAKTGTSLGETLAGELGVNTSFFGPAVGRPIIHGQGGSRIRIMEDGVDVLDASALGADHAGVTEPLLVERIEILKGPTTLLYGSTAIGGAVNVVTGRMPTAAYGESLAGYLWGSMETVNDGRNFAAHLRGDVGNLTWHMDGSYRDGEDYRIPGYSESKLLRATETTDEGEEEHRGRVDNSDLENFGGALSLSWIRDWIVFSAALNRREIAYGLPGGHEHVREGEVDGEEDHESEGDVRLTLQQNRYDLGILFPQPLSGLRKVEFRFGFSDYEHEETAGEVVETQFEKKAREITGKFYHLPLNGWQGAYGFQVNSDKVQPDGESYLPEVDTDSWAFFWFEEKSFGSLTTQLGLRYESVEYQAENHRSRDLDVWSASFGVVADLHPNLSLAGQFDWGGRAPAAEELYSDGPHLASLSYNKGDASLREERVQGLFVGADFHYGRLAAELGIFLMRFEDYISQWETGAMLEGLPVWQWYQADADFWGYEMEVQVELIARTDFNVQGRVFFDAVRAELDGTLYPPLLPPSRWGLELIGSLHGFQWRTGYTRFAEQKRTANHELPTDAYSNLYLSLDYGIHLSSTDVTLFVQGKNLLDEEQRTHTSILKDRAPLPGLSVVGGVRVSF